MSTHPSSPTALKRWFWSTLKRLRTYQGLTRKDAAAAIRGSVKTIEHIEGGGRLPTPLQLEKLLDLYGVPEQIEFCQGLLVRAKRGKDWWVNFDFESDALPDFFKLYAAQESEATVIEGWDAHLLPGLFHTEQYAKAAIRGASPELSSDEISRRVNVRLARQHAVLKRESVPPTVHRVIHEYALRLPVGSPAITCEQLEWLDHLIQEYANITIQVLPAKVGSHPGLEGSFTYLSFNPELSLDPQVGDPGLVHSESRVRSLYYETPDELAVYRDALNRLQKQACDAEETPAFLRKIMKEL